MIYQTATIEEVVIYAAHFVIRNAFLLFYLRLSAQRRFRMFVYIGFGLNGVIFLANM